MTRNGIDGASSRKDCSLEMRQLFLAANPLLGVIKSEMANITDVPVRLVVAFFSFGCSAEEDLVDNKLP